MHFMLKTMCNNLNLVISLNFSIISLQITQNQHTHSLFLMYWKNVEKKIILQSFIKHFNDQKDDHLHIQMTS